MLDDFFTPASGMIAGDFGPDLPEGFYRYQRGHVGTEFFWIPRQGRYAVMLGDNAAYPWATLPLSQVNDSWSAAWVAAVQPVVCPALGRSTNWRGAGAGDLSVGSGKIWLGAVDEQRGYRQTKQVDVGDAVGGGTEHMVFREWRLMAKDIHGKMQTLFERKPAADSTP